MLSSRSKRLVKGTARRDHAEIPVEHDEGFPHGVDDCVGEGMPILDWRSTSSATVRFSPRADGLYHEHSSTRHVSLADALKVRCVFNNGSRSAVTLPFARQRAALHNRRFQFSPALSSVLRTQHPSDSHSGYRFPPEIIPHAICLYIRFTLSFRRRRFVGGTRDHGLL